MTSFTQGLVVSRISLRLVSRSSRGNPGGGQQGQGLIEDPPLGERNGQRAVELSAVPAVSSPLATRHSPDTTPLAPAMRRMEAPRARAYPPCCRSPGPDDRCGPPGSPPEPPGPPAPDRRRRAGPWPSRGRRSGAPPRQTATLASMRMSAPMRWSSSTCMKRFSKTVSVTMPTPSAMLFRAQNWACMSVGKAGWGAVWISTARGRPLHVELDPVRADLDLGPRLAQLLQHRIQAVGGCGRPAPAAGHGGTDQEGPGLDAVGHHP
jgi:hypothetical protein